MEVQERRAGLLQNSVTEDGATMVKHFLFLVIFVLTSLSTAQGANRFAISFSGGFTSPTGEFDDYNAQSKVKGGQTFAIYNHGAEAPASPLNSYGVKFLFNIRGLEPYFHIFRSNFDMSEQFLFSIEETTSDPDDDVIGYRRGKHEVNVFELGIRKYFTVYTEEFFAEGGLGYFDRQSTIVKNVGEVSAEGVAVNMDVLRTVEITESENKMGFRFGGGYRIYFSETKKIDVGVSLNRTFQKPIQFWRFTVAFTNYFF